MIISLKKLENLYLCLSTLNEISDLSQLDLDHLTNESSNTIGSLIMHIASIEFVHQIIASENRDL